MSYTKERREELVSNLREVEAEIAAVNDKAKLVCVSKFKPASDIQALYDEGVRDFGENYVQELTDKAKELPKDIRWHFIGGLQSNKCKDLAKIENIYVVETIDSIKKARKLDEARGNSGFGKVGVYIQVNTSGEEQKSGCKPEEVVEIAKFIIDCDNLELRGLMTIGSYGASSSDGFNEEFEVLRKCSEVVTSELQLVEPLVLSMGMSGDFVQALKQGSSSVRVGSRIFGERPKK